MNRFHQNEHQLVALVRSGLLLWTNRTFTEMAVSDKSESSNFAPVLQNFRIF